MKTKNTTIVTIMLVLFVIFALLVYDLYLHNFHTVIPHQVYRSRELSKQEFNQIIKKYKIKSMINLRGAHPQDKWYQGEMDAVKKHHLTHYDFPLMSKVLPDPKTLNKLVSVLATAHRPILIHCKSGVDRTGLAAVIALILNNSTMPEVRKQLSFKYFVFSKKSVGRQLLVRYNAWLNHHGLKTSKTNFQQWIAQYR